VAVNIIMEATIIVIFADILQKSMEMAKEFAHKYHTSEDFTGCTEDEVCAGIAIVTYIISVVMDDDKSKADALNDINHI
jgi:hypothetical protein